MFLGVTVTDDTSIVANLNNLNALRWKLDNVLITTATDLVDLTPPFSDGDATSIRVQEGDEIAVEGVVLYGSTSMPMLEPSEGLSVIAQLLFGNTVVYKVTVQDGGTFNCPTFAGSNATGSELPLNCLYSTSQGRVLQFQTTIPSWLLIVRPQKWFSINLCSQHHRCFA